MASFFKNFMILVNELSKDTHSVVNGMKTVWRKKHRHAFAGLRKEMPSTVITTILFSLFYPFQQFPCHQYIHYHFN